MKKRKMPAVGKCFDHLGGYLAPVLFNRLLEMEWIKPKEGRKTVFEVAEKGKVKDTPKSIALPPYFVIVRQVGYLEAKVEMLERENSLLKEQLTYQKTSWIKRLFKR